MAELKSCPFCGGEAVTENRHNRWTDWWKVKCMGCNASLNERYEYEFEAVAAWNTRKPMEAVVAELMKLRERDKFGMCYKADEVLSCTMETSCRSCYEELVREIVRNGGKE